jgi:hypothetical protein
MPYLRDWIGIRAFLNNFQYAVNVDACWTTVSGYYDGYNCYTSLEGYS